MAEKPQSMRQVQITAFGGPEVLKIASVPVPEPGPEEVCLQVKAAALNHLDLWVRQGLPRLNIQVPHVPGSDAAGVVVAVGEKVSEWQPGDEVVVQPGFGCGTCRFCREGREAFCERYHIRGETYPGVQQEFLVVKGEHLAPKPSRLSFVEAAAVPLAAMTAWNMLINRARLQPGETVLILGAGSGVGSFGVQIAKHQGARVIATAGNAAKQASARELGADEVINHRETGFYRQVKDLTDGRGVDVVFEHIGPATWADSLKSLAWGGRLVTCGATTGTEATINIAHLFYKRQTILGSTMGSRSDFLKVVELADQGVLRPVLDRVFPFQEVAQAHQYFEERHGFGKIVLQV